MVSERIILYVGGFCLFSIVALAIFLVMKRKFLKEKAQEVFTMPKQKTEDEEISKLKAELEALKEAKKSGEAVGEAVLEEVDVPEPEEEKPTEEQEGLNTKLSEWRELCVTMKDLESKKLGLEQELGLDIR